MEKKLRVCLKEPIPEIYEAAKYLSDAVDAYIAGDIGQSEELIRLADMPVIREWSDSIWGSGGVYTKLLQVHGEAVTIPKEDRHSVRMPDKQGKKALLDRDGHYCKFCGIPVIRMEIRQTIKKFCPGVLQWGRKEVDQHAAFQAMWVQYDHVIPHARGGLTNLENMVITCAPCNYGRMNYLIEEVGLAYPNSRGDTNFLWDGLERILLHKTRGGLSMS